jgi:hypothetical protein
LRRRYKDTKILLRNTVRKEFGVFEPVLAGADPHRVERKRRVRNKGWSATLEHGSRPARGRADSAAADRFQRDEGAVGFLKHVGL